MPITQLDCPECGAKLRSASGFEPGKKVRCPKCKEVVTVPEPEARVSKARPSPARDDEDEGDEDEAPRRKKKGNKKDAAGFFTPARIAIFGGLLAAVIAGVVVLVLVLKKGDSGGQAKKGDKPRDGAPRDGSPKDGAPGNGGIAFDKVLHPGLVNHAASRAAVTKLVGKWSGSQGNKSLEVEYRRDGTFRQTRRDGPSSFPNQGTWKMTQVGGNQGGTSVVERKSTVKLGDDRIQLILDPIGKPAGVITYKDGAEEWEMRKAP